DDDVRLLDAVLEVRQQVGAAGEQPRAARPLGQRGEHAVDAVGRGEGEGRQAPHGCGAARRDGAARKRLWRTPKAWRHRPIGHRPLVLDPGPGQGPSGIPRARMPALTESTLVNLHLDIDREADGRWIAEVTDLPGVLTYAATRDEAISAAKALALRVLA